MGGPIILFGYWICIVMSDAQLLSLAKRAQAALQRDNAYIRREFNKTPQVFLISSAIIIKEILSQIKETRQLTSEEAKSIIFSVNEYVNDLYSMFKSQQTNYVLNGSPPRFEVLIPNVTSNKDVLKQVQDIRYNKSSLKKLSASVEGIFKGSKFDLNNGRDQSITERVTQQTLARFSTIGAGDINKTKLNYPELASVLRITVEAKEHQNFTKVVSLAVTDETYYPKGIPKDKLLKEAKTTINKFVEQNINLATQAGSRSPIEIVTSELLSTAKKYKAKTKGKITKKSAPSRVSIASKGKVKTAKVISDARLNKLKVEPVSNDWLSLINIINERLADRIKANMGLPRLVNRTGRFAESAKVMGVEFTDKGLPSFQFTYQKNPYDVFDRVIGALPWNIPSRDPKKLIALSIRELAIELAVGRFYTRRV